jgi:hypothetical protein
MPQMDVWSRSCVDTNKVKKQGRQESPLELKDDVTDPIPGAKGKSPFFLDEYFSWMSPLLNDCSLTLLGVNIFAMTK